MSFSVYTSQDRDTAFPLGGIGTGTISIDAAGRLCDFEIMNHPDKGCKLPYSFFAMHVESDGFAFSTALMFCLYGNPMLHVRCRRHVVESALQNDAIPPVPVKSAKMRLRKAHKERLMEKRDKGSMLSEIRGVVDGNLAAELTARLLKAGFTAELAARLVNVALALKSEDESGATLDLISVDLYTGTARLFKAGAAPGFYL